MHRLAGLLLLVLVAAGQVCAQTFPEPDDLFVNDDAGLLSPDDVSALRQDLAALKDETGVEVSVLTLAGRADPAPIEDYALGLFNAWGIGDSARNDGILILIIPSERVARIQLGSAYNQDFDTVAQDIMQRNFLPYLRDGNHAAAIRDGTSAVIERIARRKAANLAPQPTSGPGIDTIVPWAMAGLALAVLALRRFSGRIGDAAMRLRRCPSCGRRALSRRRVVAIRPTETMSGLNHVNTRCSACDWHESRDQHVPQRSSRNSGRGGGGFGGGRSSGGGATGRW